MIIIQVDICNVDTYVPEVLKDYKEPEKFKKFNKYDSDKKPRANLSVYPVIKDYLDNLSEENKPENIFIIGSTRFCCVNSSIFGEKKRNNVCVVNSALILDYNIYISSYTILIY